MASAVYVFGQIYYRYGEDAEWSEFTTKLHTWALLADSDNPDTICNYIVGYMTNRTVTTVHTV